MFCDIDPDTYCVTADTVQAALTPRTKAVIAVHLFGNVAPIAEIEALGVPVLEDAAQAAGSTSHDGRPGALGDGRHLLVLPVQEPRRFGDGGMITTDDGALAERVADAALPRLARQGRPTSSVGYNSRLDELQAAILRVQLPHLDGLGRRPPPGRPPLRGGGARRARQTAGRRRRRLARLAPLRRSSDTQVERAEAALRAAGIGRKPYYRTPVHRQQAMRRVGRRASSCPATERGRALPPRDPDEPACLTREQADEVVAALRAG